MSAVCEICRGARFIRLPIYRSVGTAPDPNEMVAAAREYPCPECSVSVPESRIQAVSHQNMVTLEVAQDPRFVASVENNLAHRLLQTIIADSLIRYERSPDDTKTMAFTVRATIGVVSPKRVASMEERVAERQAEVAREVVDVAIAWIANWNSHYDGQFISKSQATASIKEALTKVLATSRARSSGGEPALPPEGSALDGMEVLDGRTGKG